MANLGRSAVFDAGLLNNPRFKKREVLIQRGVTREVVIEKLPLGRTEKWVDRYGNVKRIKLTLASGVRNDRMANYHRMINRRAGGFPYGQCPLRDAESRMIESDFPEKLQYLCEPFEKDSMGRRRPVFHDENACPHVEYMISELQAKRKAANAEVDAKLNEDRNRAREQHELLLKQNEATTRLLQEALAGKTRRSKKSGDDSDE